MPALGGVWSQGGACSQRGGGVSGPGGGIPACTEADPPCGQTDRCKNITFATSVADGNKERKPLQTRRPVAFGET